MTKDDLKVFCGWRHKEPWSNGDYSYATDGARLIRVDKIDGLLPKDIGAINVDDIIRNATVGILQPFPVINGINGGKCGLCSGTGKIVEITCTECDGSGEVEWFNGHHDYCADCKGCNGYGKARTPSIDGETCDNCNGTGIHNECNPIRIDGFKFDANLLYHFCLLQNSMIGAKQHKPLDGSGVAYITFDGGVGVVMGLRD